MKHRFMAICFVILLMATACARKGATVSPANPDIHALQIRTFETLWSTINEQYVYADFGGVNWQQIHDEYQVKLEDELPAGAFADVMQAMLAELPEGTAALQTREARIEQAVADDSAYEGIGAFVAVRREPDPRVILLSVMPDSPAEAAGLQAHDSILAVDGQPIKAEEGHNPIEYIRGPAGSDVVLTVRSPNTPSRDVTVRRGRIGRAVSRLYWEMLDDGKTGYFLFPPSAYEEMLTDFLLGLQALSAGGQLEAIILDLRIVTMGQEWPAVSLLSLFMDGLIGEVYSRADTDAIPVEGVDEFGDTQQIPMAVLVSSDTSGPAEVFAAAMQLTGRGPVVGATTQGDVESVAPFWLPDGSRLFLATSSFRSADGQEVGLSGVVPDVALDLDWDGVTAVTDPVRDAAIQYLEKDEG